MARKTKLIFALSILSMLTVVLVVSFTEVATLRAVTVDGESVEKWSKKSPLVENQSILRQPLKEFVESSFTDEKTLKLDYRYSWPHTLNVKVNLISPDCFLLDRSSSTLYGLDENARVLPLDAEFADWERPVLTGIEVRKMYQRPSDNRLHKVLLGLDKLRSEKVNFYRLIEQVDFGSSEFIEVSVAGHEHTVRVRAELFYDDIKRYIDFVARYNPELEGIKVIDLRQDGQIVTKGKKV